MVKIHRCNLELILAFFVLFVCANLSAQNLIVNPSFETVTAEPFYGCEITNATGWLNPSGGACPSNNFGTPDLFSTFSTGQAVLPNAFMGTTNAHSGNRCAGLVTYHQQLAEYREYIMHQLTCPLVPGQIYNVSYWSTGGISPQYVYHTNNIGVYFSTVPLIQTGYNLIGGITPQFEETALVTNATWTYYTYTFIPTQAFSYVSIGNFKNDSNTQTQSFGTNRPYAYYFFDDFSITPVNAPSLNIGNDTTYCGNFSRTLSTGDANTIWSTGATGAQITVTAVGTYWATVSGACVNASDTIVISQTGIAVIDIGNDTTLCTGQSLLLDATAPASTYLWQDNSANATFNVSAAGTYSVTVTNAIGCAAVGSVHVSYNTQAPVVNLGPDIQVCGNESVLFHANVLNANYLWSDNSTDSVLNVFATGTYSLTVSTGCGSNSDLVNVVIHADECALLIPTAFSPNADGANDLFRAVCRCPIKRYALHIYNRWGELVFETTDITDGWNGIFRSTEQPMEVYVYYIDYFNYCEQKMKKVVGNVTLVK